MDDALAALVSSYDPDAPLAFASTIPASWYVDPRIADLERRTVFAQSWQFACRAHQVRTPGQFVSCELAGGEPMVIVRGSDGVLRAFYNVCRHHAAAVVTEPEGVARHLRCPYHGWTYSLEGALKGTPDFGGVCDFDRASNGLVPVHVDVWEQWVFVRIASQGPSLAQFLDSGLREQTRPLQWDRLQWVERRTYTLDCNWKVFIDNYLDGGYHVPYLHKGLDSVLDYREYAIETGARFCLQHSPLVSERGEPETAEVRQGDRARYYWVYPNFMVNAYGDTMDTNLVLPMAVDRTRVIFDFYFADVSDATGDRRRASIDVSHRIQEEDEAICRSVQRGLASGGYTAGRLSVRREAGEHLFHRLLHADLLSGLPRHPIR